ncbi:MAG TPA: ABC transporter ATP-binding protein [Chloroflexi bacterium]|nr:ABC transporter ATP-binding protein [Chloroflexota bacterium]
MYLSTTLAGGRPTAPPVSFPAPFLQVQGRPQCRRSVEGDVRAARLRGEARIAFGDSTRQTEGGSEEHTNVLVEMRGITKRFPGVVANQGIDLLIRRGEIHTVLGENGAGKSTLMNILAGMIPPDEGSIIVRGEPVTLESPHKALSLGIGTVYQHFTLVPTLTIIENVILGRDSGFLLDVRGAERRLQGMLGDFGISTSPRTPVGHLSVGQQQRVEIIKVLFRGSEVLLLDEPTSVLTPLEVQELFQILLRLKAEGVAVVFITHKLEEALQISDRITVLRQGQNVGELGPEALFGADRVLVKQWIVDLMFGGLPPQESPAAGRRQERRTILALHGVTALGDQGRPAVQDFSLALRAGEIFGLAGVDGNGQKELGEVIAGQRRVIKGQIVLDGIEITNRGAPAAVKAGIGYVTDDRLGEGSISMGSVAENLVLKAIDRPPFSKWGLLNRKAIEANALRLIRQFEVKTPGPSTRLSVLSGGNVQKLILARELALNPRVLVANKPTSGLDLKTARFVLRTLKERANQGSAILLISSELDELLELSDRIGVIYNGCLLATFGRGEVDLESIGRLMLGAPR